MHTLPFFLAALAGCVCAGLAALGGAVLSARGHRAAISAAWLVNAALGLFAALFLYKGTSPATQDALLGFGFGGLLFDAALRVRSLAAKDRSLGRFESWEIALTAAVALGLSTYGARGAFYAILVRAAAAAAAAVAGAASLARRESYALALSSAAGIAACAALGFLFLDFKGSSVLNLAAEPSWVTLGTARLDYRPAWAAVLGIAFALIMSRAWAAAAAAAVLHSVFMFGGLGRPFVVFGTSLAALAILSLVPAERSAAKVARFLVFLSLLWASLIMPSPGAYRMAAAAAGAVWILSLVKTEAPRVVEKG